MAFLREISVTAEQARANGTCGMQEGPTCGCTNQPTMLVSSACVHEHIGFDLACQVHHDFIAQLSADFTVNVCNLCLYGAAPHKCEVVLTWSPL